MGNTLDKAKKGTEEPGADPGTDPGGGGGAATDDVQAQQNLKFQERIDGFTRRLTESQTKIDQLVATRTTDQEAFNTLSAQYKALSDTIDTVEDKVAQGECPDYETNPKGYYDFQMQQMLNKVEKIVKPTAAPKADPAQPTPATEQKKDTSIDVRAAAMSALHDDYDEVIAEVNKEIVANPALESAIWTNTNPYKAAYDHGIKVRAAAAQLKQDQIDQGFVEGGGPAGADDGTLSLAEKNMVARMKAGGVDMTEEKYLAGKKRVLARTRKRLAQK